MPLVNQLQPSWRLLMLGITATLPISGMAETATTEQLENRVQDLERELEQAKSAEQAAHDKVEALERKLADVNDAASKKIEIGIGSGKLQIGGAVRVNYAIGDYGDSTGGPSRAEGDGGNFSLDTFRFNFDYRNGPFLGKAEYRFYNGYHFLHTGWLGYDFEDGGQVQVGVNRVPFGPGPYGISQSWFFDQHYYVGLADDMDLGMKYSRPYKHWKLDIAYYYSSEGTGAGDSKQSARYSYDVVNESGQGYEERNQFNIRAIYSLQDVAVPTDLGLSLQYGQLKSQGPEDDGHHYAASVHMVNKWDNFKLATQLTRYEYDVDADQPLGTVSLVQYGAYDFPSTAAAKAWIPAISLSNYKTTPSIYWLDYVIPYIEYSSIIKDEDDFNNSDLFMLGAAWAHGGWYIYTDLAYSNGNEFVGGETAFGDRLGINADDEWQYRFNVNFGYYF